MKLYKKDDGQISISEFYTPFGKLNPKNRWVRIAEMIPWTKYERKYADQFCEDNGAPAIKFRMAMGTLIIKQRTGHSDEEVIQDIIENPYLQYLIGLYEFTNEPPFASTSITNFRKYITEEMLNEINDDIFRNKGDKDGGVTGGGNASETAEKPAGDITQTERNGNEGELLLDATCAPAYIRYPTDISLLNEAREKLEGIIDALHPRWYAQAKPRTYRQKARKAYLRFIKQRKPKKGTVRKAIGQQLRYVRRDLTHVERLFERFGDGGLSGRQIQWYESIRVLYDQQLRMYETRTHTIKDRIVSINQSHVRPIVRGKVNAAVEFGAKVSVSMVNGYAYLDRIGWDAYNEDELFIPAVERYKERNGFYPKAVMADRIYRNRENLAFCKDHEIRLSGPRLGRPPKETDKAVLTEALMDSSKRNAIEGKFGEGKTKYGLDRIMARLKGSSETVIALSFLCMNISRRLRVLLCFFQNRIYGFIYSYIFEGLFVGRVFE